MATEKWAELDLELEQAPPEKTEEQQTTEAAIPEAEGIKSPKVNDRIRKLVNQRREKEAKIEELENRLVAEQQKYATLAKEAAKTYSNNVGTYGKSLEDKLVLAQRAYEEAYDKGDSKALAAANQLVVATTTQLENLKNHKQQVDHTVTTLEKAPPPTRTQATPRNESMEDWVRENSWFQKDTRKTRRALMHNDDLVEEFNRGEFAYDAESPEFYEELNKRLENEGVKKSKPKSEETDDVVVEAAPPPEEKPRAVPQMSSSRGRPSASGNKVRLTLEEQNAAKKLGIQIEEYARQKLRASKSSGPNQYTEIFD